MKKTFGFKIENNAVVIHDGNRKITEEIYKMYLDGESLDGIKSTLEYNNALSHTGKNTWSRASIDKILSNPKYIDRIINFDTFLSVQYEKEKRSNTNEKNARKTTRYNSQNVLSGLLVCHCCGKNYRRVTRSGGEVVWRCADKVENGKKSLCSNINTVSDTQIRASITDKFGQCTDKVIKDNIVNVMVSEIGINIIRV